MRGLGSWVRFTTIYLGMIIGIGDELEGAGVSYFGVVGLCCCGYETEKL